MSRYTNRKLFRTLEPDLPLVNGRYQKRAVPLEAQGKKVAYYKFMGQNIAVNISPGQRINLKKEIKRQIKQAELLRKSK